MRMINPTIATTITMTTTFGSLKLWLPTTSAAAIALAGTECHYPFGTALGPLEQPASPKPNAINKSPQGFLGAEHL